MSFIDQYLAHEAALVERFHSHPYFQGFEQQTNAQLKRAILQNAALSFQFVQWYDQAILSLKDQEAITVLETILQDETPIDAPNHRQDLLADLEYIGIKREDLIIAINRPSFRTRRAKQRVYELADYRRTDLQIMASLRTAGEVLVAEGYRHLCPELERRFGLTQEDSRFYWPHFIHDRIDSESGNHSHSFLAVLEKLMTTEQDLEIAKSSVTEAYVARLSFYDQFAFSCESTPITIGVSAFGLVAFGLMFVTSDPSYSIDSCIPNEFTGLQHCYSE
jgi:hypothetical protein